jgi:hypothetical protein
VQYRDGNVMCRISQEPGGEFGNEDEAHPERRTPLAMSPWDSHLVM